MTAENIFNGVTSFQELIELKGGFEQMGSLKATAEDYTSQKMRNISELKSVDVNEAVLHETRNRPDGTTYEVDYIVIDGEEYRVPSSVLAALKEMLSEKPKMKTFKVKRTGTTKEDTRYTLIPLE